jgi:AsmA-like C-terminal region
MKLLRLTAGGLLLLLVAIPAAILYVARNENQIVNLILAQVAKSTGPRIETSGARLGLGTRLVIVLEQPRVLVDSQERARLGIVRVVFSYWTLLHRSGLPLYTLVLERGTIVVEREPHEAPVPKSVASRLETLTHYLDSLASVSRRFDVIDITLLGEDHRPLAEHVSAVAYRPHYRGGSWPWVVNFSAGTNQDLIAGAQFAGNMQLGLDGRDANKLARGEVWFWDLPIRRIKLADFGASGRLDGDVKLAVSADAHTTGNFTFAASDLTVARGKLSRPLMLGRYNARGSFYVSSARAELADFVLHHEQSPALEARATIFNPYDSSRAITFSASGFTVELTDILKSLSSLRGLPQPVLHLAERIRSGTLMVNQVALKSPESFDKLNLQQLVRQLDINAALTDASYIPAPETRLPPVYDFDAQLNYSAAVARITQATGQIGGSSISDLKIDVDLSKAPKEITYRLKLASWLDAGDIYAAMSDIIQRAQPKLRGQLLWVYGHTAVQLEANGTIKGLRPSIPADYLMSVSLGDVGFEVNRMPSAIWLDAGSIVLKPSRIAFSKVVAVPLGEGGNVAVNGVILPRTGPVQFRDFTLDFHQIASEKWVPLMVDPGQISVVGPIGGRLTANSRRGLETPTVVGKLTLDHGTVQPGFLRNPINVTNSATLVLDGKGLILDLPASWLEGEPLDFRLGIADLNHPQIRIDASVKRLDFEVMRFIRLPWSPSTPPQFFPVPVAGHIEAQGGNFDKLAMSSITTDFFHNSQAWQVNNFRATAFNGSIALTISGRAQDDWININGLIEHMDAGPLFLLSGKSREPPILGKLAAKGDFWADTNTDFFRTLAGTVSIAMRDGTLNRFTLMKRILSLVNLKNYLTAQFPDPRKAGMPFKTLDADFQGTQGNFYTDNLRLNGPVMDITARGNIDFTNNTMDMEIDLLALQTVNWLINNIPIIGKHLGGATKHLVGAYFQVRGPTDNPSIRPKPLTSVAEFVLRTLTLPINIIAPNTIE